MVEAEELGFFESLIGQMESELELDAGRIAAALAWMATKGVRCASRARTAKSPPVRPVKRASSASSAPGARRFRGYAAAAISSAHRALRARAERPGSTPGLVRYKVNVGREQGVTPRDLVGAIANEGNIESRFIGRIDLFDDFSTVELPADLSADKLEALRRVRVRQVPLGLSPDDGTLPTREKPAFRDGGNKFGGPRREGGGFRKEGASSATAISSRVAKVVVMVRADPSRPPRGATANPQAAAGPTANRPATAVPQRREGPSASDRPQRRSEGGWSPAPGPRSDGNAPFKGKKFRKD